MANEEVKSQDAASYKVEEKQQSGNLSIEGSLNTLAKVGGFDFLEAIVDGVDNLNPVRKAKKNIFLTDDNKKEQRSILKNKINMWLNLLNDSDSVSAMVDKSGERVDVAEKLLKGNLKKVLETSRELEQSYRSVNLFYKNTESTKTKKCQHYECGDEPVDRPGRTKVY